MLALEVTILLVDFLLGAVALLLVLVGDLVCKNGLDEVHILEVGLQERVEVAGYVSREVLLPMFFKPTGTPDFLILCSGFRGSKVIFLSLASLMDISIALLSCASSS